MTTNKVRCGVSLTTPQIYGHEHDKANRHICKKKPGHHNKHKCKCGFKFLNMFRRDR